MDDAARNQTPPPTGEAASSCGICTTVITCSVKQCGYKNIYIYIPAAVCFNLKFSSLNVFP